MITTAECEKPAAVLPRAAYADQPPTGDTPCVRKVRLLISRDFAEAVNFAQAYPEPLERMLAAAHNGSTETISLATPV
jgi:hypothetical protein